MNDHMLLIFKSKIQNTYPNLTSTERKLADYILQNPEKIIDSTASQLAEAVNVSAATVIRFCKSCGFSGFTELRLNARREFKVSIDPGQIVGTDSKDSLAMVKQKLMGYHMKVIHSVLSAWNEAAYKDAADALMNARNILIIGSGGSKAAALSLADILFQLNFPCDMWDDASFEAMKIGTMNSDDVVIGISYSGRFKNTIRSLKLAKERGITTIGITGMLDSPIINYTDILLNTNLPEEEYEGSAISARIAETAVVEVIYLILSSYTGSYVECIHTQNEWMEHLRIPLETPGK